MSKCQHRKAAVVSHIETHHEQIKVQEMHYSLCDWLLATSVLKLKQNKRLTKMFLIFAKHEVLGSNGIPHSMLSFLVFFSKQKQCNPTGYGECRNLRLHYMWHWPHKKKGGQDILKASGASQNFYKKVLVQKTPPILKTPTLKTT